MRRINKLTSLQVSRLKEPGRYGDGSVSRGGLWLQITAGLTPGAVTKSWLFRYTISGRARQMGLGAVAAITLVEAREKAQVASRLLDDGQDPIETIRTQRALRRHEAAGRLTFRECGDKYIEAHENTWRNPKHRAQWKATLEAYAYPAAGELPVDSVDKTVVLKILEPIWATKAETATRLRGRIERILDWAKARDLRAGENPARWKGHLDKLLPARSRVRTVRHHPALPFARMPAFMSELRGRDSISARALEITALTALRTSEVIRAQWPEIDLPAKIWTVPPDRMKGGREHRVPLSGRAVELLEALPRERGNDYVFIGASSGKPLSDMAMLELMRGMAPGYVPHGLRSTFRDWAAETTNYPNHVVEMALAHVIGDDVEAAYRRGDLFEKRRRLMRDWAAYCGGTLRAASVVPMKRAGGATNA